MLAALHATASSTMKAMKLSSRARFARSQSAIAPSILLSAPSRSEKARTTEMPWTYSRTAPTMARWLLTRLSDTARDARCMMALTARTTRMVAMATSPQRGFMTASMRAMTTERVTPAMTLV